MSRISRRGFLGAGVAAGAGLAIAGTRRGAASSAADRTGGVPEALRVDGLTVGAMAEPARHPGQPAEPRVEAHGTGQGRRQSAYEIRVSERSVAPWARQARSVGERPGDRPRPTRFRYGGAPLASRARACWQVRVWDERGRVSAWSPVGRWETGC